MGRARRARHHAQPGSHLRAHQLSTCCLILFSPEYNENLCIFYNNLFNIDGKQLQQEIRHTTPLPQSGSSIIPFEHHVTMDSDKQHTYFMLILSHGSVSEHAHKPMPGSDSSLYVTGSLSGHGAKHTLVLILTYRVFVKCGGAHHPAAIAWHPGCSPEHLSGHMLKQTGKVTSACLKCTDISSAAGTGVHNGNWQHARCQYLVSARLNIMPMGTAGLGIIH